MPSAIRSFLEVIREAKEVASLELSSFMDYVQTQIPEGAPEIEEELECYYLGCISVFEQSMIGNGWLASKAEAISRIGVRDLQDLCAALHSSAVVARASQMDSQGYAMIWV